MAWEFTAMRWMDFCAAVITRLANYLPTSAANGMMSGVWVAASTSKSSSAGDSNVWSKLLSDSMFGLTSLQTWGSTLIFISAMRKVDVPLGTANRQKIQFSEDGTVKFAEFNITNLFLDPKKQTRFWTTVIKPSRITTINTMKFKEAINLHTFE